MPPAAATPRNAIAYSGVLGINIANTSPLLKPRSMRPVEKWRIWVASSLKLNVLPLGASISAGRSPSSAARVSTTEAKSEFGKDISGSLLV